MSSEEKILGSLQLFETDLASLEGEVPNEILLKEGTITLGRSSTAHVLLNPMKAGKNIISRNHAILTLKVTSSDKIECIIEDPGSLNGVYINQKRIKNGFLYHKDILQLGGMCEVQIGEILSKSDVSIKYQLNLPLAPRPEESPKQAKDDPTALKDKTDNKDNKREHSQITNAKLDAASPIASKKPRTFNPTDGILALSPKKIITKENFIKSANKTESTIIAKSTPQTTSKSLIPVAKTVVSVKKTTPGQSTSSSSPSNFKDSEVISKLYREINIKNNQNIDYQQKIEHRLDRLEKLLTQVLKKETTTKASSPAWTTSSSSSNNPNKVLFVQHPNSSEKKNSKGGELLPTMNKQALPICNIEAHSLKKHLNCTLCNQLLIKPVVLPCSHGFCFLCIEKHLQLKKKNICCPVCQIPFSTELQTLYNLKALFYRSDHLDSLIWLLLEASTENERVHYHKREAKHEEECKIMNINSNSLVSALAEQAEEERLKVKEVNPKESVISSGEKKGENIESVDGDEENLEIDKETLSDYEEAAIFCDYCGEINHTEEDCPHKIYNQTKELWS